MIKIYVSNDKERKAAQCFVDNFYKDFYNINVANHSFKIIEGDYFCTDSKNADSYEEVTVLYTIQSILEKQNGESVDELCNYSSEF